MPNIKKTIPVNKSSINKLDRTANDKKIIPKKCENLSLFAFSIFLIHQIVDL